MDFDFKIRLLGYYHLNNQKMNPEDTYVDDAERLAKLLEKSFANIVNDKNVTDAKFLEAFKGKGVFIFKDERSNLYAYSPSMHLARISNVKYNKNVIMQVDFSYKKWFIPGEPFSVLNFRKVTFVDLSDKRYEYKENVVSVRKVQNDYIVRLEGSDFAIKYENVIPIHVMKELVLHRWIALKEYESKEFCGNCDGWDYSGCDMSRCRDVCEGCGGRKYKCNDRGCFYYRNKVCVEPLLNVPRINDDLNPAFKYMEELSTPLNVLYRDCIFMQEYAKDELIDSYVEKFDKFSRVIHCRKNANTIDKIKLILRSSNFQKQYLMPIDNLNITTNSSFLFWGGRQNLEIEGYDYNSDTYISKESYSLLQKDKSNTEKMMDMLNAGKLKVIRLENWSSDNKWSLGYE